MDRSEAHPLLESRTSFGMRTLVTVLAWMGTLLGIAGLLSRYADSDVRSAVVLAALLPAVTALAVVPVVMFAAVRRWLSAAVAAVAFLALVSVQLPLYVASGATPDPSRKSITVLQANIAIGRADADDLVSTIVERDVDVVAVSELTAIGLQKLTSAGLQEQLPYSLVDPRGGGAGGGIWSRFPLTDQTRYPQFTHAALGATAAIGPGAALRIVAVHPVAPWPDSPQTWSNEFAALDEMTGELTAFDGPVVIAGDFNATSDNAQFRSLLRNGFVDSRRAVGAGLVPTFPANRSIPPILAIDHVLVDSADVTAVEAVDLPGSDHRGVLVSVVPR